MTKDKKKLNKWVQTERERVPRGRICRSGLDPAEQRPSLWPSLLSGKRRAVPEVRSRDRPATGTQSPGGGGGLLAMTGSPQAPPAAWRQVGLPVRSSGFATARKEKACVFVAVH